MAQEQTTKALQEAIKGLSYQSESAAPFEVVYWEAKPGTPLNAQTVLALSKSKGPVEEVKAENFFRPLTKVESWHGPEEKAQVAKYQRLQKVLQQLQGLKVFKVGEVNVDIYIVGLTDQGDIAGVKTQAVET